jgi:uncharacterized membrane protein (DUF2068 family)
MSVPLTPVRWVALFEILKGVTLVAVAAGILRLLHGEAHEVVAAMVARVHLAPENGVARSFLRLADDATDPRLWFLSLTALSDAVLRFAIGVGLWRGEAWGYWLGAAAGAAFVPIELLSLAAHVTPYRLLVLGVNIAIVIYLVRRIRTGLPTA